MINQSKEPIRSAHKFGARGALIVLALSAIQSLAQSTFVPYTFTTLAGGGGYSGEAVGSAARFNLPGGVAVDTAGNVYVADWLSFTIRKVTPAGAVTTLAGLAGSPGRADGTGSAARFVFPDRVAVDSAGNVFVAAFYFNTIRKGFPARRILNFGFNLGQFTFDLTGPAGRSVVVEASSDLASWLPLWTNTFAGTPNSSDPASGVFSNPFYSAHTP